MSLLLVIDEAGNDVGKVKVGDTKQEALERLDVLHLDGRLRDREGLGLTANETITEERAPYKYVLNRSQQQQQQTGKLEGGFVSFVLFAVCCEYENVVIVRL